MKQSLKIYVDSSYDWNKTVDGTGTGEIAIVIPERGEVFREKLTLSVPGLKQLNNRFELAAIELGIKKAGKRKNFVVYSDSQVAIGWASHSKVKWLPREQNIAGKLLGIIKKKNKYVY